MRRLRDLPALRGFGVEWAEPGHLVVSRRNRLYAGSSPAGPFRPVGDVPAPLYRRIAARSRPLQRLLRHMIYNVLRLGDSVYFVTFDRSVGVLENGEFRPLRGWDEYARVLRGACAIGRDGAIYFGAYLGNPKRREVRIFRYALGQSDMEVVYTFAPGIIRHVHGVFADPWDNSLWVTAGDIGDECRILRTSDYFRSIEQVGGGDETWRCVCLQFTETGIVYGMDAQFCQNWLYVIERETGRRRALQALEGPVYYSASRGRSLYFAVTAELCPSQVGRAATLWEVHPDRTCTRVAIFKKDWLPVRYFMPGTLDFPNGPGLPDQLLFRCTAVVPDNRVMSLPA